MSNPLKVLSRLFGKNPNNVVLSELYSIAAQPLFMHPQLGEAVMRSYLDAAQLSTNMMHGEQFALARKSNNVAVLDISGALVAREMSVPCGQAPASYEGIKQEFQALLNSPEIDTIVGRFDSPGGAASQNMDLSDFIYASRGQGTRLIAMVDDMAYSAAFGIASAFEEVWVTRTSGVGSVGVVSYHVDRSEANARMGIKYEYIFAGDKKVLGNPNEPLSDPAKVEYQAEVSRLYELFTSTIARNMGMSIDAVKATEAGTYHGEAALTVGFAHKIGTFDELLSSIVKQQDGQTSSIRLETDAPAEPELSADAPAEPELSADAPAEPEISAEEIAAASKVALAADIRAICEVAGLTSVTAESLATSGMPMLSVQAILLEITNSQDASINSATSVTLSNDQAKIKAGWDAAFAKVPKL